MLNNVLCTETVQTELVVFIFVGTVVVQGAFPSLNLLLVFHWLHVEQTSLALLCACAHPLACLTLLYLLELTLVADRRVVLLRLHLCFNNVSLQFDRHIEYDLVLLFFGLGLEVLESRKFEFRFRFFLFLPLPYNCIKLCLTKQQEHDLVVLELLLRTLLF